MGVELAVAMEVELALARAAREAEEDGYAKVTSRLDVHQLHDAQPGIWKPAFGGEYCGPCAAQGYMWWKQRRNVFVPVVMLTRDAEVTPAVTYASRTGNRVRTRAPDGRTWKEVIFEQLRRDPKLTGTSVAAITGCKVSTADVYVGRWRKR